MPADSSGGAPSASLPARAMQEAPALTEEERSALEQALAQARAADAPTKTR